MTTNAQGSRPSSRPGDPTQVDTIPTPVVAPTGVGGVAVYDRDVDARPSASMVDDRVPVTTSSSGSILTWVISAVVLIILVYFLLQFVF